MSSYEMLEKFMICIGFMMKAAIIVFPLSGACVITFIILNDEFMGRHKFFAFTLTAAFSFTCHLLTLWKTCALRRKPHAKNTPLDQLWDSDLIYENETEKVPHYKASGHYWKDIGSRLQIFILKNPLEFCKFRPAYGMFFASGVFLIAVFIAALAQVREKNDKDDFFCVAKEVAFPMVMLTTLLHFISNSGIYIAEKEHDVYVPFEEYIQIPMRILIGKTAAFFVTSVVTRWLLLSFIISVTALCVTTSDFYHGSEMEELLRSLLLPIYPEPQKLVRTFLVLVAVSSVSGSIAMILFSFVQAKKSILGVIEKNWQRNLLAIDFLLPKIEADTLGDLKEALDRKANQPLTEIEKQAFQYIYRPIWRSKPPFMYRKFEAEAPESVSSDRQLPDEFDRQSVTESENVKPVLAVQPRQAAETEPTESSHQLDEASAPVESKFGQASTSTACFN